MNISSEKVKTALALFILFLSLTDLTYSLYTVWDFTTDDAYISWRYASQLVAGHGFLWHQDIPLVEGFSNFLWVILSALIIKMQWPLLLSIKIISCCCLVLTLFFLYRLSRLFLNRLLATLPILIFSHYQGVSWWTVSGMETMLYCSLCLFFTWQSCLAFGYTRCEYSKKPEGLELYSTTSWLFCNVSLLLLALTRFEGLIWAVPLLFFMVCQYVTGRDRKAFLNRKHMYCWFAISFFGLIIPYLAYFIWRVYYFGHWVPNSFTCKTSAEGKIFVVDFDYLLVVLPLLIVSMPYLLSRRKDCKHLFLWFPSLLYGILLFKANPVVAYFLRLFLGPFALLTLLPVLGLVYLREYISIKKDCDLLVVLAIALLTWTIVPGGDYQFLSLKSDDYKERSQIRLSVAQLLNQKANPNDSVYLSDCGIIPFFSRRDLYFIDAQCLNNPELTQSPYKENMSLYAKHLISDVKPDWIIVSYYPEDEIGDYLTDLLFENDFYNHYQFISTVNSGYFITNPSGQKKRVIDFVYQVYRRKG